MFNATKPSIMVKLVENFGGDAYASPAVSYVEVRGEMGFCQSLKPVKPGEIEPGEWGEDL